MLEILNLNIKIDNKEILNGINLKIKRGEIHSIMGPNGAGKSTLANAICGRNDINIVKGKINFLSKCINKLTITTRARMGIFMSNQHPIEIPGVNCNSFLKASINSVRKFQYKKKMSCTQLLIKIKEITNMININPNLLLRDVNVGFSGGEKKKFEMLQMLLLEPQLIILDEIDSGLDIDAIQLISKCINNYKSNNNSFLIITHYNRILNYIPPDFVHIISKKKIIKTGNKNLSGNVEMLGYNFIS